MNILHINTVLGRGGAGKVVESLMKHQIALGHSSSAIVAWDYRESSICQSNGITEVYKSEQEPDFLWPDYGILRSFDILKSPLFKQADIIHLHNLHGNYFNPITLLLISLSKPTIWTLHDMDALTGHCTNSLDCLRWKIGCGSCPYLTIPKRLCHDNTLALWRAKQELYKFSPFNVVAPSKWLYSMAFETLSNKSRSFYHIQNPIDDSCLKKITQGIAREYLGIESHGLYVGMVAEGGTKNPYKGIEVFVKTLELLNNKEGGRPVTGLIIGGDYNHNESPYVKILRRATDDCLKMSAFYSALDVYLSTSIAENYPISLLEAMECGVPIIGKKIGGVPELLEDDCGLLVESNNEPEFIANAVTTLLNNPVLANKLCNNAIQKAAKHNVQLISLRYMDIYNECLSSYCKPFCNEIRLKSQPKFAISTKVKALLKKNSIVIE